MSKPPETLTFEETEKLLGTLRNRTVKGFAEWKYLRNYTMALLMLDAGLRVGEVVRLRVSDLILAELPVAAIAIQARLAEKGCERVVPTSARLRNALQECWTVIWQPIDLYKPTIAFFKDNFQHPISIRQVQRTIEWGGRLSLGRRIHPHVLRHTFATRLMRITSTSVVQQLLGHKHLSSTQVYMHANGDDCKKAIDCIENRTER